MGRFADIFRSMLAVAALFQPVPALQASSPIQQPEQDLWPHAPQVTALRKITMPSPDLSTGAVNISIPIYELEVEDLKIPISLDYRSNGIRVNDDPFPTGYGWTLNPGLKITRQVLGRPDGKYQYVGDRNASSFQHSDLHRAMVSAHAIEWSRATDTEKDIFTIRMPGISFCGILNDSVIRVPGHSEYAVSVTPGLSSVTVMDPFGRKWLFAGKGSTMPPFGEILEWGLTSVTFPSGREITFDWVYGLHLPSGHTAYRAYDIFYPLRPAARSCPYDEMSGDRNIDTGPSPISLNLKTITFPGGKIEFTYNGGSTSTTIQKISVCSTSDSGETTQTVHTIGFEYGDAPSQDTMLQALTFDGNERYSFSYDPHTFGAGDTCDLWGYYNRSASGTSSAPAVRLQNPTGGAPISIPGSNRFPNRTYMSARMLTKVTYPTGGILEFEYEPHSFRGEEFFDARDMLPGQSYSLSFGGGLRLTKSILRKNPADSDPQWVEYVYGTNGSGLAQADALPLASTFLNKSILVRYYVDPGVELFEHGMYTANLHSSVFDYRFGEDLIWYPEVTEVYPEGRVTHRFEKLLENEVNNIDMTGAVPISVSTLFSNGIRETERLVYSSASSGSGLLEKTEFEYDCQYEGSSIQGTNVHRNRLRSGFGPSETLPDFEEELRVIFPQGVYAYNEGDIYLPHNYTVWPDIIRLLSKKVTRYTDTGAAWTLEEYEYKEGTQLIASTSLSNCAESLTNRFTYYDENSSDASVRAAHVPGLISSVSESDCGTRVYMTRVTYGKPSAGKSMFRPMSIAAGRAQTLLKTIGRYEWNDMGDLIKSVDRAGVATQWTWDSHGRYPVARNIRGKLKSTAQWKPLVGVSSLTDPDSVRTEFRYDTAGRLTSVLRGNLLTDKYVYSISQTGTNSITSRHFTGPSDFHYSRTLLDGLGRECITLESRETGVSAQLTEYDVMGRPCKKWAPVYTGYSSPSDQTVRNAAITHYGTGYPYSSILYESSPRNIEIGSIKAGTEWHNYNKTVKVEYLANTSGGVYSCPSYTVTSSGVSQNGVKPSGTVMIRKTTDEDGITVMIFTDIRGHEICRKQGKSVTSYVYDSGGNLRYILPPGAEAGGDRTSDTMKQLAYWYDYDAERRPVVRKLPGRAEERIVYDAGGRIAAMRTADHESGVWRLFFYDDCGREVLQIDARLSDAAALSLSGALNKAGTGMGGRWKGYVITCAPALDNVEAEVVSAHYYDNYDFINHTQQSALKFKELSLLGIPVTSDARYGSTGNNKHPGGRLTGLYTGRDFEAYYYDNRGLELQRQHAGIDNFSRTTLHTYDGSVLSTHERFLSGEPDRDTYNSYDNLGRLTEMLVVERGIRNGVAAADTARIAYTYDGIGRLAAKTMGNTVQRFSYDVHGWPSSSGIRLNVLSADSKRQINVKKINYSETLRYADNSTAAEPCYNGFVSRKEWGGHAYDFEYDKNGFLISAEYSELSGNDQATGVNNGVTFDYSAMYGYDLRGNMTRVERRGITDRQPSGKLQFGTLDKTEISYNGNQARFIKMQGLNNVASGLNGLAGPTTASYAASAPEGLSVESFPDLVNPSDSYLFGVVEFDSAGRVTKDPTRGIQHVEYDNNGMPVFISVYEDGAENSVAYERDGAGNLLKAVYSSDQGEDLTVRYTQAGRKIENGRLTMSTFPGGYFDDKGVPLYYLYDYEGNIVKVFTKSGRIVQSTDYYPYGEPWGEGNSSGMMLPSRCGNHYLFGSKERISQYGLNLYDFTARLYNASQARFLTPDPMAESTPWLSPYAFCASNPINFTDQSGMIVETIWDIGNVLYDAGAAIYHYIKGNHKAARSSLTDLGMDTAAALLPFVPAGASKAVKAIDKASDIAKAKASQSLGKLKNAAKIAEGREFEEKMLRKAIQDGDDVKAHITLIHKIDDKKDIISRTNVDQLIRNGDGTYSIREIKLSPKSRLSKGQRAAQEHVNSINQTFEIRSKIKEWDLMPGDVIEIKDYQIIYKY